MFTLLFIIILINNNYAADITTDKITTQCKTPDNLEGYCISLRQCQPLWKALSERQKLINNIPLIDYLRRSHCGYEGNTPTVCCLNQTTIITTPSPTIKPTQTTPNILLNHRNIYLLPKECGTESGNYIVGGTQTKLGEHPWLVGIEYENQFGITIICGGSLISDQYILTAAHCMRRDWLPKMTIRLGEHDQTTDPDCVRSNAGEICAPPIQRIPMENTIIHPKYRDNSPNKHYDIALIRMRRKAVLSNFVKPVCLPTEFQITDRKLLDQGAKVGSRQTVVGWGRTETAGNSNQKLRVILPIIDNGQCTKMFNNRLKLDSSQMCAGAQAGKDSCNGDSGGPLMSFTNQKWLLNGVVSVGPQNCGTRGVPGIYTRVSSFIPWILENMSNESISCNKPLNNGTTLGNCIDIRQCGSAINMLREKPRKPETTAKLLESVCGEQRNGMIPICCPLLEITAIDKNPLSNNRLTLENITTVEEIKLFFLEEKNETSTSPTSTNKIELTTSTTTNKIETVAATLSTNKIEPVTTNKIETVATTLSTNKIEQTSTNSTTDIINVIFNTTTSGNFNLTDSDIKLIDEFITIAENTTINPILTS